MASLHQVHDFLRGPHVVRGWLDRDQDDVAGHDGGAGHVIDSRRAVDDDEVVVLGEAGKLLVDRGAGGRPATGKSGSPAREAAQSRAEPCGSASTSRTRFLRRARASATWTASVVLPTPPFWFNNAMVVRVS